MECEERPFSSPRAVWFQPSHPQAQARAPSAAEPVHQAPLDCALLKGRGYLIFLVSSTPSMKPGRHVVGAQ